MKRTISLSFLVALVAVGPAFAEITIVDSVGFGTATGSTGGSRTVSGGELGTFTANGVDKLVVAVGTESGFKNNTATVTGVTVAKDTHGAGSDTRKFARLQVEITP